MADKKTTPIFNITHPEYDAMLEDWQKYRLTYEAGRPFVEEYLRMFSSRENSTDFDDRRKYTYVPAHAKAALNDIKNAIYQRMVDITREGGPQSYKVAITGYRGGVDLKGNSMNGFIGRLALPELLAMGKVGVFIDKQRLEEGASVAATRAARPYIYLYKAEDIRSWTLDNNNEFKTLLLRDHTYKVDDKYGLMDEEIEAYRLLKRTDRGVEVMVFDAGGNEYKEPILLRLSKIPFVLLDIAMSLLTDVADYQIALMNLSSSDINYTLKANFPFYTEQYSPIAEMPYTRQADGKLDENGNTIPAGTADAASIASDKEVKVGTTKGRRYPRGLERPGFIHPSSEPIDASMKKQEQMKQEIRQIINLNLTNIEPRRASAEAKSYDERGLEAGLSYLGLELEYGEREIAGIWAEYESNKKPEAPVISYPKTYSLRSEEEVQKEAESLTKRAQDVPSLTYQKEMMKRVVSITMSTRVSPEVLDDMKKEIDATPVVIVNPEVIRLDTEAGICSKETASKARNYPDGDVEKANKEHAERAKIIAISQTEGAGKVGGVPDVTPDGNKDIKEPDSAGQQS